METPCVRFDDLSPGGSGSFGLLEPAGTITAKKLDDVVGAVEWAEDAARNGLWAAGFVSYEAAPAFNPILTVRPPGLHDPMRDLPLARFAAFEKRVELEQLDTVHFPAGDYNVSSWTADSSPDQYREDLAAIGRAIMAGEVSRLLHTFRLRAAFNGDPAALYRDVLLSQRGPHAACMDLGRFGLVSASPAGYFRRTGSTVVMRPVLASIRRGRWLEEDRELAAVLRERGNGDYVDEMVVKEIETELSELGDPVPCAASERFSIERLETLWHLVANLGVHVDPTTTIVDVFKTTFPPVTLTGIPKVEAMDLIAATEDTARAAYCGTIGFLAPSNGPEVDASFSVAVRTIVVDQEEGVAEFGVGTAITTRSDVVSAYEEARLKAKVLVERRPDFMLLTRIRCEAGKPLFLEGKLDRMADSAEYFGFGFDREAAEVEIETAIDAAPPKPAVVTIFVDRLGRAHTEVVDAPRWSEGAAKEPLLHGVLSDHAVSSDNVYLFHETTYRRVAEALTKEHPDADVIIVCNERRELCGALTGNVVVEIGDDWVTPPLGCGSFATEFRNRLIAEGRVVERRIDRDELSAANGLGVVDDVHGWRSIKLAG